nr:MAG TPA: hypothetical protein [Caudoviricetes sp.]
MKLMLLMLKDSPRIDLGSSMLLKYHSKYPERS